MVKTAVLFYFSGTGNTKLVSELLAKELQKFAVQARLIDVAVILKEHIKPQLEEFDAVGIAYPVYAMSAPRIIYEFVKILPKQNKKHAFLLRTAGDNVFDAGSTLSVKKRLAKKGYLVFNERLIIMPSNVFLNYNPRLVKQLYNAAVKRVINMAQEIFSGKVRLQPKINFFFRLLIGFLRPQQQFGCRFLSFWAKVTKDCNLCGKCSADCPVGNLVIKNKSIKFRRRCLCCMRCIYHCPQKAIKPHLFGKIAVIKEGYNDISKIIANPDIRADYIDENTKGYFSHYNQYFKED